MKILIEKAVIEQALEALEMAVSETLDYIQKNHLCGAENNHWIVQSKKAITALREALAEQAGQMKSVKDGCDYCNSELFAGTKCNNCGKNKTTDDSTIEHTTAKNYEHFLSYMYGSGARHSAVLCKAYFDGADAPHEEYEAYMAEHHEQAEQEPVAWMNDSAPMGVFARHKEGAENFGCTIPLYAAPVRTKDLTDDEELELARSSVGKSRHWLVAAAIAAYKEKNK